MSTNVKPPPRIVATLVVVGALAATVIAFLLVFAPAKKLPVPEYRNLIDAGALRKSVAPTAVARNYEELAAVGSRFPGQPGHARAAGLIEEKLRALGYEVSVQPNTVVAPVTKRREILGSAGQPLAGVEIYPVFPNLFQPIHTPPAGVSGELLLLDESVLESTESLTDRIGVLDVDNPLPGFGYDWQRYAQLGLRGLIVASRRGLDAMPWDELAPLLTPAPVNYPRVIATTGFSHWSVSR